MNKLLIIFLVIFLLLLFIFLYNYNKKIENFSVQEEEENKTNVNNIKEIENFNKIEDLNLNNLIKNGNFENGQNSLNQIKQSGYNKIIVKKNPGKTSYVLYQKSSESLTYYEVQCDSDKNSKYNFYFWLSIGNNSIEELDFNHLINRNSSL